MNSGVISESLPMSVKMSAKSVPKTGKLFQSDRLFGLILVIPAAAILLVLIAWPLIYSLVMSLSNVIIGQTINFKWVGLRNYLTILQDVKFRMAFTQTVFYSASQVSGVILIGLAIATLLNRGKGVWVLKHVFLLPWALSPVINAVIWGWIFNGGYGVLNYILLKAGIISQYHVWLAEPQWALLGIVSATVWKGVPFVALMLLAAMQNVPRELIDAAKVDGANAWEIFRKITLPCIKPTLMVLLVIETMWSLKSFDLVWVLTQGGPVNKTMLLSIFSYQESFRFFKFGTGSASAFVITGLIFLLTLGYIKLLQGFGEE